MVKFGSFSYSNNFRVSILFFNKSNCYLRNVLKSNYNRLVFLQDFYFKQVVSSKLALVKIGKLEYQMAIIS